MFADGVSKSACTILSFAPTRPALMMAAAIPRLGSLTLLRKGFRIPIAVQSQGIVCQCQCQQRKLHSSPVWRKKKSDEEAGRVKKSVVKAEKKAYDFDSDELSPEERAAYNAFSPKEQEIFRAERKKIYDFFTSPETESRLQGEVSQIVNDAEKDAPHIDVDVRRVKSGFWNMGEVERDDTGEDEVFQGDDLNEIGHAELEQHREMRHYARIAAWEMPLLSKLATPFTPPTHQTPLRFRYTTYMGETHPAAKKMVLEFCVRDLPSLTPAQRIKFIKLVGPRYNPENDIVKMSSEMFETQAQNKRYLGDLVDTLMTEAKNVEDMFEDVPLDFRHHRFKKRIEFPEEWKVTGERKARLEAQRQKRAEEEKERVLLGKVVDGEKIMREALAAIPAREDNRILLESQQGKTGAKGRQMLR